MQILLIKGIFKIVSFDDFDHDLKAKVEGHAKVKLFSSVEVHNFNAGEEREECFTFSCDRDITE